MSGSNPGFMYGEEHTGTGNTIEGGSA